MLRFLGTSKLLCCSFSFVWFFYSSSLEGSVDALLPPQQVDKSRSADDQVKDDKHGSANHQETPKLEFKRLLMGNGRTSDGVPTYFTSFESSRGNKVYRTLIDYSSSDRSNEELNTLLKNSIKVIRKAPENDEDGHRV